MDRNNGRVLTTLDDMECEDDTVVMLLVDNGATDRFPKPKRGGSFSLDSKKATWRTDGMPKTYRGRGIIRVEGKSLLLVFLGDQGCGHPALFWELYGHRAVRKGP